MFGSRTKSSRTVHLYSVCSRSNELACLGSFCPQDLRALGGTLGVPVAHKKYNAPLSVSDLAE